MERPPVPPNLRRQMEGPSYLGPSSFAKVVQLSEPEELDRWKPDIAIVGAPWDDSTSYRPGSGPGRSGSPTISRPTGTWTWR